MDSTFTPLDDRPFFPLRKPNQIPLIGEPYRSTPEKVIVRKLNFRAKRKNEILKKGSNKETRSRKDEKDQRERSCKILLIT